MNSAITHGFADELSKLAKSLPAQGLRTAMKEKGLTISAQTQQKAMQRAGDAHNIPITQAKNMANLPKPPKFDK